MADSFAAFFFSFQGEEEEDYEAMHLDIKPAQFDPTSMKTAAPKTDTTIETEQDDYLTMDPVSPPDKNQRAYNTRGLPPKPSASGPGAIPTRSASLAPNKVALKQRKVPHKPQKMEPKEKPDAEKPPLVLPTGVTSGRVASLRRMYVPPGPPSDAQPLVGGGEVYEECAKMEEPQQKEEPQKKEEPQAQELYEEYTVEENTTDSVVEEELYEEYNQKPAAPAPAPTTTRPAQSSNLSQVGRGRQPQASKPAVGTRLGTKQTKAARAPPRLVKSAPPKQPPPGQLIRASTVSSPEEGTALPDKAATGQGAELPPKPRSMSQLVPFQMPERSAARLSIGAPPTMPSRIGRRKPTAGVVNAKSKRESTPSADTLVYEDPVADGDRAGIEEDLEEIEAGLEYATAHEGTLREVKPRMTSKTAQLGYEQLDGSKQ